MASSVTQNTGFVALINANNNNPPPSETTTSLFGEDGFTFGDIIDIVNPLQHIPIVNNIYRKITGDTIAPAMEIAGGALFGGPIGAVASLVTTAYQSYIQDNKDSTDPDSPYGENEPTAVAINTSQQFPNTINNNDYSTTANLKEVTHTNTSLSNNRGWSLISENINRKPSLEKTNSNSVSINTSKSRQFYQPADGIINLAHKKTEAYTNTITATKIPTNSIDIIIGSTLDPS